MMAERFPAKLSGLPPDQKVPCFKISGAVWIFTSRRFFLPWERLAASQPLPMGGRHGPAPCCGALWRLLGCEDTGATSLCKVHGQAHALMAPRPLTGSPDRGKRPAVRMGHH